MLVQASFDVGGNTGIQTIIVTAKKINSPCVDLSHKAKILVILNNGK